MVYSTSGALFICRLSLTLTRLVALMIGVLLPFLVSTLATVWCHGAQRNKPWSLTLALRLSIAHFP